MPRPIPKLDAQYGPDVYGQAYAYRTHAKTLTGTHTYAQMRNLLAQKRLKEQDKGIFKGTSSHPMPPHARSRSSIGNQAAEASIRPAFGKMRSVYEAGKTLQVRSGGPWQPWFNTRFGVGERGNAATRRSNNFSSRIGPESALGRSQWAGARSSTFSRVVRPS